MLCNRLQPALLRSQYVDQAAYRTRFSSEDHLLAATLLIERCSEWNVDFWFGLVDFEKAFDTIEHDALWQVLVDQGVDTAYIDLLMALYANQTASVSAGTQSRSFVIERGVKQGDPISTLLFIAVMEAIFSNLENKRQQLNTRRTGAYYGLIIDDPKDPLTNLRFADDVLLLAATHPT